MIGVAYIDFGENCDLHPRVKMGFPSWDKAKDWVNEDIRFFVEENTFTDEDTGEEIAPTPDYAKNEVWKELGVDGRTYTIFEITT